tara:strand:+ start:329 stop:1666 length:1338 start_codon:yes stop_codon:yes gene_type:complete
MADPTLQLSSAAIGVVMYKDGDAGKPIDLTPSMISCDVVESIDKKTIQGALIIQDSEDLMGGIGVTGAEAIWVSWQSQDTSKEAPQREVLFRIAEMNNITPLNNNTRKSIQFSLVAVEQWENAFSSINMVVEERIDKAIKKIYDKLVDDGKQRGLIDLKDPEPLEICDKTSGKGRIVIPGMAPFSAIELLTARAVTEEQVDKLEPMQYFAFYQNRHGFNFANIQKQMMEDPEHEYEYNPISKGHGVDSVASDETQLHYSALELVQLRRNNLYQLALTGGMHSQVTKVDYLTKSTNTIGQAHINTEYLPTEVHISRDIIDKYTDFGESGGRAITPETHMAYVDGSSEEVNNIQEAMIKKTAMMSLLYSNMTGLSVHGNSALTCGENLNLKVMAAHSNVGPLHEDELMGGKYLIKDVTHQLRAGDQYTTSLVLTRIGAPAEKNEVNT